MKVRGIVFTLEWILANWFVLKVLGETYSFYTLPWILWNITFGIFLFKLFNSPEEGDDDENSVWPIGPTVGAIGFCLTAIKIDSGDTESTETTSWNEWLGYGICVLGFALIGIASEALGEEWSDAPPPSIGPPPSSGTDETSGLLLPEFALQTSDQNSTTLQFHLLVTNGPYAMVRHPIYCGLLLEALGSNIVGGFSSYIALGALISVTAAYVIQLTQEERELNKLTQGQYESDYTESTKYRLVPFVF